MSSQLYADDLLLYIFLNSWKSVIFPVIYFPYKGFILSYQSIRGGSLLFPGENYYGKSLAQSYSVLNRCLIICYMYYYHYYYNNINNVKSKCCKYCTNTKYFLPLLTTNLIILNLAYFIISV